MALTAHQIVSEIGGYEQMAFIAVPSLLGQALRPNSNDHGKDLYWGGNLLYKGTCSHGQLDCALIPPHFKKHKSHQVQKSRPFIEELLDQKAKADKEFQVLLVEVRKMEVEEKERVEEKQKAEEVEERWLKEEWDKALAKWRVEEVVEKRQKVCEVEETWRMEEAEVKKRKADKVKALADQIVENYRRSEEAWRPSSSKAIVPRSVRVVLLLALTVHQIASEVAQSREKGPRGSGSGPTISLGSDSDLDN